MTLRDELILKVLELSVLDNESLKRELMQLIERGGVGANGREIQLEKSDNCIRWKYVNDSTWTNLVALSDLTGSKGDTGNNGDPGTNGREIELQSASGYIQWRYVGDALWTNLIGLFEIKGEKGDKGDTGPAGKDGVDAPSGGNYDDTELRQLLNSKANTEDIPTELADLTSDAEHRTVSDVERQIWNSKSNFSGNYNDLVNKPTIPTIPSNISAFTNDSGYLTEHQDISNKVDKIEGKGLSTNDYADEDKEKVANALTEHQDISNKLTEPTGLAVGKYFRVASIDENGHAVLECVDAPSGGEMKIKIAGTAQTPDSDGYVNVPYGAEGVPGVYNFYGGLGIAINAQSHSLQIVTATDANIRYRNHHQVITSANIDKAVKAAMTDGKGSVWTDTEKQGAWTRQNIIKTTLDSVLVPLSQYYLGEQSSLNLVMPTTATVGQEIIVCFSSGTSACQLTCDLDGFDFVPKANKSNKITFTLIHKADTSISGDEDVWNVEVKEG